MRILFDTNLWISFMIGRRLASLREVLYRHDVEVYVSEQELDEIATLLNGRNLTSLSLKKHVIISSRWYMMSVYLPTLP